MAGTGISTYLQNALLLHVFRNTSFTRPTAIYVSLHTEDPTDAGTGHELSGDGYERQPLNTGASSQWTAPGSGNGGYETDNAVQVAFPVATDDWGHISHFALWDDDNAGNMLFYGELAVHQDIDMGYQAVFEIGNLGVVLKSPGAD